MHVTDSQYIAGGGMNADQYVECDGFRNLGFKLLFVPNITMTLTRFAVHPHRQSHSRSGSRVGQAICKSPRLHYSHFIHGPAAAGLAG